jgi:hypothetical protein
MSSNIRDVDACSHTLPTHSSGAKEKEKEDKPDEGLPGHWRYYRERRDGHLHSEFVKLVKDRPVFALLRNFFGGKFINKVSGRTPKGAEHISPVIFAEIRNVFDNETGKGFTCVFVDDNGVPSSKYELEPDLSRDLILAYNAHPGSLYADRSPKDMVQLVERVVQECFDPVPKATQGPFIHNCVYYRLTERLRNRLTQSNAPAKSTKRKRNYGTVKTQKPRSNKCARYE